jgi:Ca-activated chloride channel homolog
MKIDASDERWTAYALGEITDEKERAELESALKQSEEIRRLVEDIRSTANMVTEQLRAEPAIELTQAQREHIKEKSRAPRMWFGFNPAWAMACAATVMLAAFFVIKHFSNEQPTPQPFQVAERHEKELAQIKPQGTENPGADNADNNVVPVVSTAKPAQENPSAPLASKHEEAVRVDAKKENLMLESSSSVGMVLSKDKLAPLPSANNSAVDLIKVMGGVAQTESQEKGADKSSLQSLSAANVNVQRDGVTGNDIRWPTGMSNPVNLNPALISEFKMILTPVDAELARSAGTLEATKSLPNGSGPGTGAGVGSGSGGGVGAGMGTGVGSGSGGGMGGGYGGGIGGGYAVSMAPPPPPSRATGGMPPLPPPPPPRWRPNPRFNTESYDHILDNAFLDVVQNPLSTFSIDVDTASYSNMRRYLDRGALPPKDSVRIEELVNYFDYDYKPPKDSKPFAANFELTEAPWNPAHLLLRIGLKGREIDRRERPNSNLVFLLDVSGSMGEPNKLPLVKQSMHMLLNQLTESDRVSIVVYATDTRVWMPPTSGDQKMKIGMAIDRLEAGGSTNGAGGIQLAYQMAQEYFIKKGVNRVILATDGDFNVGITNRGDLTNLIEEKAKSGIFLSALGFGMGNLKDATLEMLANKGRGNYAYIDTLNEAYKVLVEQMNSTLIAIAKDVKIQVEFNPKFVGSYRLIGYEDKVLAKEDFNNDEKMASVIGAGHRVTAFYELVPPGNSPAPGVDPLKYQKPPQPSSNTSSNEMLTLKIRSKEPDGEKSVLSEYSLKDSPQKFSQSSQDFRFAASVAAFGMVLRDSPYRGNASFESALQWAREGKGIDKNGYREEFLRLINRAISLSF